MGEPVQFQFEVGAKVDGLTKMNEALDASEQKLAGVDKSTTKTSAELEKLNAAAKAPANEMEALQKRLAELERPGKLASLRQRIKDLEQPTKEVHGHAVNLGHAFEDAKGKVLGLGEALGLVIAFEAVEKLVEKVKELGTEVLKAGAAEQRSNAAIEMFFGEKAGKGLLEYVDQYRKLTEFNEDEVKDMMLNLGRAGFSADEIPRAMAAAGDMAARFKNHLEGAQTAIGALSMIQTTGRIEARQFKRLGLGEKNAPDKFYEELAKRTGKGVAILKKEMEQGKVPVEDTIESLYKIIAGSRGQLGVAALKMGQGMSAKLTHFAEIPELLFESVEKSPAFDRFAKFIGDFSEKMGPEGPLGKKLADGLGKAFDTIADKLSKLEAKDIEGFVDALASLPHVIAELTKVLIAFLPVASKLAGGVGFLFGDSKDQVKGSIGYGVRADPEKMFAGLKRLQEEQKIKERLEEMAKHPGTGIEGTMIEAVPQVYRAGAKLGDAAVKGAKGPQGIDAHSPSKKFAQLGRMAADGYSDGLDGSTNVFSVASARAVSPDGYLGRGARAASPSAAPMVNITLTVQVGASNGSGGAHSPQEIGQEVRAGLEQILPGILQDAFEKMALEAAA
jgi:tape measure domain-containing protein